jgi:hypothetical protein
LTNPGPLQKPGWSEAKSGEDSLGTILTGGTKKRQQRDIAAAAVYWRDYKRSKRGT